jgi:transposase
LLYAPENVYRQIGDLFADVLSDEQFADMYSHLGTPALSPTLLSLVSLLQFMEHLSDRQTLVMVRSRLDWKYALHLELEDAGFDPSVLSDFRKRLEANEGQRVLFDAILERLKREGLLSGRRMQRTDSLTIVSGVRRINRLELVLETMRLALEAIAVEDAEWVRERVPDEWLTLYGEWAQAERVVKEAGAKGAAKVRAMQVSVGEDGFRLLGWLETGPGPRWEREPEAIETLRRVWRQQYRETDVGQVEVSTKQTRQADGVDGDRFTTPHDVEVWYRA